MKILDLLEKQIHSTVEPDGRFNGRFRSSYDNTNSENSGYYSSVKGDKTDPHMIVKHTKNLDIKDPYSDYIQYLIKHDLIDSNPHFPRVYNIKKIVDKNGKEIYKYRMERLEQMGDLNDDIKETILKQNFDTTDYGGWPVDDYDRLAADILSRAVRLKHPDRIKQSSLKEAVLTLYEIYANNSWTVDLHRYNFMIRRTPTGFQIVLTDPFS